MSQTINLSNKNNMYIIDFPTVHCLRHKKITVVLITILTQ